MQIVERIKVMHLFQISLQRPDKLSQRLHILLEIGALAKQLGPIRREAVHHLRIERQTGKKNNGQFGGISKLFSILG